MGRIEEVYEPKVSRNRNPRGLMSRQGSKVLDRAGVLGLIQDLYAMHKDNQTFLHARFGLGEDVLEPYKKTIDRCLLGDFATVAPTLTHADVVTLNRVVCCYPDAEALLRGAAARARRLVAFTYPRDRWYIRTWIALQNFSRRQRGNEFRTFVHAPQRMGAVLEAAGFVRAARQETTVWVLDLYHREGAILRTPENGGALHLS